MNTKALVIGSHGLLGSKICNHLEEMKIEYVGLNRRFIPNLNYPQIIANITDYVQIKKLFENSRFSHVINSAALTSQQLCQADPHLCKLINYEAVKTLAYMSDKIGAKFVQISTDAVFDGKSGDYSELSATNPFSYYGESKLLAEKIVLSSISNSLILRGSFFGSSKHGSYSILQFFVDSYLRGIKVPGYTDIISSSISASSFSKQTLDLSFSQFKGVFHLGSEDKLSKHDFGRFILEYLHLNSDLLISSKIADQNIDWNPPRDLSLNCRKAQSILKYVKILQKEEISMELKGLGLNEFKSI